MKRQVAYGVTGCVIVLLLIGIVFSLRQRPVSLSEPVVVSSDDAAQTEPLPVRPKPASERASATAETSSGSATVSIARERARGTTTGPEAGVGESRSDVATSDTRMDAQKGFYFLAAGEKPPDVDERAPDGGPKYNSIVYTAIGRELFLERGKQYRILKEWTYEPKRPPMTPAESARHKELAQLAMEASERGDKEEAFRLLQEMRRIGGERTGGTYRGEDIQWFRLQGQSQPTNAEPIVVDLRGIRLVPPE